MFACHNASSTPSALALYLVISVVGITIGLFIAYVVRGMMGKSVPSDRTCLAVIAGLTAFAVVGSLYLYAASASGVIHAVVCLPHRLTAAAFMLSAAGVLLGGALAWMWVHRRREATAPNR